MSLFPSDREPDEDDRIESIRERRALSRATRCVCDPGGDMPGSCPGPANCPYSGFDDEEGEP